MNTFNLTVSTPDGIAFTGDAGALFVRGSEGDLAILANHAPLVTAIQQCECRILPDEESGEIKADVKGGLLYVADGGETTLLTTSFQLKD